VNICANADSRKSILKFLSKTEKMVPTQILMLTSLTIFS
jgi:hypothetical protein